MPVIHVFTDGSCIGNPGPGGYAAIMFTKAPDGKTYSKKISGGEDYTTNNRMELLALVSALETLNQCCQINVYTDSNYLQCNFTKVVQWDKDHWEVCGMPVKNADLWKRFKDTLLKHHSFVHMYHVPAHKGVYYNELCDSIAKEEARKRK